MRFMAVKLSLEACIRCGACMDECPEAAICYDDQNIPYVIEEECTDCGECIQVCCTEALEL
jgi:pyruvate formate lyase activating enzyme